MKGIRWSITVLLLLIAACQEEESIVETPVSDIAPELVPYFERFESESLSRDRQVLLSDFVLVGMITEIEGENVVGKCSYSTNTPRTVRIDADFWEGANDLEREYVVFHELGHCLLNRDHLDTQYPNGTCVSIMQSGTGTCKANYSSRTRSLYLDELFQN